MMARLSLVGMYNWDNRLFDNMSIPTGFSAADKTTLINNILLECAELEVLYPAWSFLKSAIDTWSVKELITWQRIFDAAQEQYNPIENYNRTEKTNTQNRGAMTHSGTDSVQGSGSDSDVSTGYDSDVGSGTDTQTTSNTSFDSNTYQPHDKVETGLGSTLTHNRNTTITHNHGIKDSTTYGHTITDSTGSLVTSNISGNIGVTTSQQMLEQELELAPKLNTINYIVESFKNRFCLLVY